MAAGAEVVCNEVARKVGIEEECASGLSKNDLNVVGGDGNSNGGGSGKDDDGDSTGVFVSGGIEVSAGDTEGVDVDDDDDDDVLPQSDSAGEVDQFKKEELGVENEGIPVDPLALETNAIVHGITTVSDPEVKAVKDDVNLENGSTVDPVVVLETKVIAQDENGHVDKISGEQEADVKSAEEVEYTKEIKNVEVETDDIGSGLTSVPESTLNAIENSQVTVSELESAVKPYDVAVTHSLSTPDVINRANESLSTPLTVGDADYHVMVDDGLDSLSNLIDKEECRVTVEGSGKMHEDLEFQVTADGSESSGSPIEEREGQATVDGSGKPSGDLESQVTADQPESCESPIKEGECDVSVNGPDSTGSLVDNQDCLASIDELEPSGNYMGKVDSNTIVMKLDGKSEEHQELLVITSEVNVEAEPNHFCSGIKAENKKSEGREIQSGIESEGNPDSGLVLSEEGDDLANGQVIKFDRIMEMGEIQISATEADGLSEKLLKVTESIEMEVNTEEMKEQVKVEGEIQESQRVVIDNVHDDLNLEENVAVTANDAEVSLETEANIEVLIHGNTSLQYGVNNCIYKAQEGLQPEASPENVDTTNDVVSECNNSKLLFKDSDLLSNPDDLTSVEQKVDIVSHMGTDNRSAVGMDCGTGIENIDVFDDDEKETEAKDAVDVPHLVTEIRPAEGMNYGTGVENVVVSNDEEKEIEFKDAHVEFVIPENGSTEDMDCETGVKSFDFPDEVKESEVIDAPVGDHSTSSFSDKIVNSGTVIEFGSIGRHVTIPSIQSEEVEDMNDIQSDEVPNSSVDCEVNDSIDVQNEEVEVLEYNFLIKIPRFEDETFRDQIRSAQVLVDEKTRLRDSIRSEIQEKRAKMRAYNDAFNAAKLEEVAARRLVKAKRQEIESVQAVINRWKNAMSVEDIDAKIYTVEHMIQHETLRLKDEKQFLREIRQLKSLRDQLALNMGTAEEIRHAIDSKDHNEERMKILRKELDPLKDKVSKIEEVLKTIGEHYQEESKKERELQAQFRAADDVRQKAYAYLNSLKKLSYDKNANFRQFKEDLTAARNFASHGDKDALHRLCANQVETFMEQWNNDDEFRKEYVVRWNMIASRRQKALDGGPLAPDVVVTVPPSDMIQKIDRSPSPVSIPGEVKHISMVLPVEQGKDVSSTENKNADNNSTSESIEKVSGQKNQELKNKCAAKPTGSGSDDMAKGETESAVVTELAENILTKEEIELARKAEELRNEEVAAQLKEQRRLEEKAKAIEALERKKRNAEKAQLRAELRARKEAEQKEKEREKRLRKKEKKKTGGGDGSINGEEAASSESSNEATAKEIETTANKKKTPKPPAHFFSKQLKPKPVPPPVINKNKKRWQQLGKMVLGFLVLLFVFLLANCGLFFDFKSAKFNVRV